MGTAEGQNSDMGRPADEDAGTEPVVDTSTRDEPIGKWVHDYEKRSIEVTALIARGGLEGLIERLLDDDEHKRYDVAGDIAKGGQAVIPRAIELAEDARPRMREMACYILGQVGYPDPDSRGFLIHYPEGVPALIRCLEDDPEPDVRAAAAAALGHQQVPATLPVLCRAASDPDSEVRFDVACALGSFYEDAWEEEEASSELMIGMTSPRK